jgi:hypothetical protein
MIRITELPTELRMGVAAWCSFILATCLYCLVHQAFVAAITPDPGRTVIVALREWGAWALLAPCALHLFRQPLRREMLPWGIGLGLLGACLPMLVDSVTGDRSPGASLALFWPRNVAMALGLFAIARLTIPRTTRTPAEAESLARRVPEPEVVAAPRELLVTKGADQCLIRIDDIEHVSAAGNYVDIGARGQRYLLRTTLAELAAQLPGEDFMRIHRCHIVRVRDIERIRIARSGSGTVYLRGGAQLAISKAYRGQLRERVDSSRAASIHPRALD